jgi:hypothetical protein
MKGRVSAITVIGVLCVVGMARGRAASRPDLSGTWTLNRSLSEFPPEVGFDPDWHDADTGGQASTGRSSAGRGGRGGSRGSGGGGSNRTGSVSPVFESEEDSRKNRELINEIKEPADTLTISQTDAAVTMVDAGGRARTFHTGGKEDKVELDAGPLGAIAKWENAQLVIRLLVEKNRELRYRYSRDPGAPRLLVEVQFADHGRGAIIRRTYDLARPN